MKRSDNIQQEDPADETSQSQSIPVKIINKEEPIRVTDRRFWVQPELEAEKAPGIHSFKPSYVEELEKKLMESQRKLDEVLASYREHKAESAMETQRAKERIQNEYNRRLNQAKSEVIKKFIDVLENFERALTTAQNQRAFESLLAGVQLIRNQFVSTFTELGVKEVEVSGKSFNPETAEAIGVVEVDDEGQEQQVLEVVSKGYTLEEVLVRPARVKVGKCRTPVAEN